MNQSIRLPKGSIVMQEATDPDYPGIFVEYISDEYFNNENYYEKSHPGILFEYNKEENQLRVLIWNDVEQEDYTDEIILKHKDFNNQKRNML